MTATDALEQALDLVRFGWCQEASARDVNGRQTYSHSLSAVQFSLDGALSRATHTNGSSENGQADELWNAAEEAAVMLARHCVGFTDSDTNAWAVIQEWNDVRGRKKSEVEQLIKEVLGR